MSKVSSPPAVGACWCITLDGAAIPAERLPEVVTPATCERLAAFRAHHAMTLHLEDPDRLPEALADLRARGVRDVLLDGPSEVLGRAFDLGIVDRVMCVIVPSPALEGPHLPAVAGQGAARMTDAWEVDAEEWTVEGSALVMEGRIRRRRGEGRE